MAKTDPTGKNTIFTLRPGTHLTHDGPAHIYIPVNEPNDLNAYDINDSYLDEWKLSNHSFSSHHHLNRKNNRVAF